MSGTRYVIVELYDDAAIDAQECAKAIVRNLEDVKEASPAVFDGFGRFVMLTGQTVTENARLGSDTSGSRA